MDKQIKQILGDFVFTIAALKNQIELLEKENEELKIKKEKK